VLFIFFFAFKLPVLLPRVERDFAYLRRLIGQLLSSSIVGLIDEELCEIERESDSEEAKKNLC